VEFASWAKDEKNFAGLHFIIAEFTGGFAKFTF
jgi:hypothetical protein